MQYYFSSKNATKLALNNRPFFDIVSYTRRVGTPSCFFSKRVHARKMDCHRTRLLFIRRAGKMTRSLVTKILRVFIVNLFVGPVKFYAPDSLVSVGPSNTDQNEPSPALW